MSDSEWADTVDQYAVRYDAQPEVIRFKELEAVAGRVWDRKWEAADELMRGLAKPYR